MNGQVILLVKSSVISTKLCSLNAKAKLSTNTHFHVSCSWFLAENHCLVLLYLTQFASAPHNFPREVNQEPKRVAHQHLRFDIHIFTEIDAFIEGQTRLCDMLIVIT